MLTSSALAATFPTSDVVQSQARASLMYSGLKLEIIGARLRRHLTELDVANGTGLSVQAVKNIEGMGLEPSLDAVLRIVAFLELDLSVRPKNRFSQSHDVHQPL